VGPSAAVSEWNWLSRSGPRRAAHPPGATSSTIDESRSASMLLRG
jgi:hypothetical protein